MNIEDLQNIKAKLIFQNLLLDHTFVHRLISLYIFKGEGPVLGAGGRLSFFFPPKQTRFLPQWKADLSYGFCQLSHKDITLRQ